MLDSGRIGKMKYIKYMPSSRYKKFLLPILFLVPFSLDTTLAWSGEDTCIFLAFPAAPVLPLVLPFDVDGSFI